MFGGKKEKAKKKAARGKGDRRAAVEAQGEVLAQIRPDGDFFSNVAACFKNSRQNIITMFALVAVLIGLGWLDNAIPVRKASPHVTASPQEVQDQGAAPEAEPESPAGPETAPDAGETPETVAQPAEAAPPEEMKFIAVPAMVVEVSDVLSESGYNYEPANVSDGDLGSCWAFHGSTGSIGLQLDGTHQLAALALCNGYGLDDTRYYNNNRITGLRISFSDGSSEELYLDADAAAADFAARELTLVRFVQPHSANSVYIEIIGTVGGARFDDTCLSELLLLEPDNGQTVADLGEMVTLPGGSLAPAADFIFPYSSTQSLSDADLDALCQSLDSGTARMVTQRALNEIYARYGYNFHPEKSDTAADAYSYFHSKDWYNAICEGTPWDNTGAVPVNDIESANINLIAAWQSRHGMR